MLRLGGVSICLCSILLPLPNQRTLVKLVVVLGVFVRTISSATTQAAAPIVTSILGDDDRAQFSGDGTHRIREHVLAEMANRRQARTYHTKLGFPD